MPDGLTRYFYIILLDAVNLQHKIRPSPITERWSRPVSFLANLAPFVPVLVVGAVIVIGNALVGEG